MNSMDTDNMLSVLDNYTLDNPDDISRDIANDFRRRRVEKNLTREEVAAKAGVAVSNIVRFEQKGLISLKNLIGLAIALGYVSELRNLFVQPKYDTMEELTQIRKNSNKKRAYKQDEDCPVSDSGHCVYHCLIRCWIIVTCWH